MTNVALGLNLCMDGGIQNMCNPTNNQDAATKWYVDNCGGGGPGSCLWTLGIGYIYPASNCTICTTGNLNVTGFGNINAGTICVSGNVRACGVSNCLGVASTPGAFAEVNACCGMFVTCATAPRTYGTTCICSPLVCGQCVCAAAKLRIPVGVNCY